MKTKRGGVQNGVHILSVTHMSTKRDLTRLPELLGKQQATIVCFSMLLCLVLLMVRTFKLDKLHINVVACNWV